MDRSDRNEQRVHRKVPTPPPGPGHVTDPGHPGRPGSIAPPTSFEDLRSLHPVRAGLVGESPALRMFMRRLVRLARAEVPVLLEGEVGSGKENAARALHLNSARSAGPFVAERGATLRDPLFLRHLFGHRRGAFTGASASAPGLIETADGGTLYLDEVADIPLGAQSCLLRVLDTGEFRPLGAAHVSHSDFRLVASSSCDLRALVGVRSFLREFYFRLRGAVLLVPPLRSRRSDIVELAERFLATDCGADGVASPRLTTEVREALVSHDWPGNVRELRNELRQAVALSGGEPLTPDLLQFLREAPLPREGAGHNPIGLSHRIRAAEAAAIEEALRASGGNKAEAARRLGLTRRTLYRRLERLRRRSDGADPPAGPGLVD